MGILRKRKVSQQLQSFSLISLDTGFPFLYSTKNTPSIIDKYLLIHVIDVIQSSNLIFKGGNGLPRV